VKVYKLELLHAVCQVRQSCLTDYTCVCVCHVVFER